MNERALLSRIVLASESPRRLELLRSLGLIVDVAASGYVEMPQPGVSPADLQSAARDSIRALMLIRAYRIRGHLQSNLDPDMFWRVHRSYLVNIHRIKEVIPWFKSSFQLRMDDKKQTEVPVSRVQTKRLRALLKL